MQAALPILRTVGTEEKHWTDASEAVAAVSAVFVLG
jgi:hypothetical protein